jgi:hypothetical protein
MAARRVKPLQRALVRRRGRVALGAIAFAFGIGLIRWQFARLFVEHQRYALERRSGRFEVRRYPPSVQATTTVEETTWRHALQEGFRRLYEYTFGKNTRRDPRRAHERLRMTGPVMAFGSVATRVDRGPVTISLPMPEGRTMESLPVPADRRVRLRRLPERRLAVLRFHGKLDAELIRQKQEELAARVRAAGLRPRGMPTFAGYDPPATLPFLRRHEVWMEIV